MIAQIAHDVEFKPNAGQEAYLRSRKRNRLACSGVGGGKSAAGAVGIMLRILRNGPINVLIAAPTYDMLWSNTIPPILQWWPESFLADRERLQRRSRKNSMVDVTAANGARLFFRSGNDPDTLRGPTYGLAWLDEAGQYPDRYLFDVVLGRIRAQCPLPGIDLTTTPKGLNWLYDLFVENPPSDEYATFTWAAMLNERNLDPGFFPSLSTGMTPLMYAQEVEGKFVNVNASAFLPAQALIRCERSELPAMVPGVKSIYVGVDVGRDRDLFVIWSWGKHGDVFYCVDLRVIDPSKRPDVDFDLLENELAQVLSDRRVRRCAIDATGMGSQFAERASRRWPFVDQVKFTSGDVKQAVYTLLRRHVEQGTVRIPAGQEIRRDLLSLEQEVMPGGGIRLRASRNASGHADRCCAAALGLYAASQAEDFGFTFAMPGKPDPDRDPISDPQRKQTVPPEDSWLDIENPALWQ